MPLLDMLGLGQKSPDSSGLLGMFNDNTAMRLGTAGSLLGNLSITGQGAGQNPANQLIAMQEMNMRKKKLDAELADRNKMVEAAQRYADKIRPSNPELADAIISNPELIRDIWQEKVKTEFDPQTQAFNQIFGTGQPNQFSGAFGGGQPAMPEMGQAPAPVDSEMQQVPQMPPSPMFESGGSMTDLGPVDPNVAAAGAVPEEAPEGAPVSPQLQRIRQALSIPDLTEAEAKRLMLAGPQGFRVVHEQILDNRSQAGREVAAEKRWEIEQAQQAERAKVLADQHAQTESRLEKAAAEVRKQAEATQKEADADDAVAAEKALNDSRRQEKQFKITTSMKLGDDLNRYTKGYQKVMDVGERTKTLIGRTDLNGAEQMQVLYDFIKALDADSAVREGEVGLARDTNSYLQTAEMYLRKIDEGTISGEEATRNMVDLITKFAAQSTARAAEIKESTLKIADRYEIPRDWVLSTIGSGIAAPTEAAAPAANEVDEVPD